MKKIYTFGFALLSSALLSQTPSLTPVSYRGAFPVTDGMTGTTSNDWTAGWANWDPANETYAAVDSIINSNITTNRTLSPAHTYQLVGNVSVTNGAELTILPGTVIRGDLATKSSLIIARGSKIHATGTATSPIVFTSNELEVDRGAGDWGGVIILGAGVTNTACATCGTSPNVNFIEGFVSTFPEIEYGGNNNADNSGELQYVRIEFAGVALSSTANSEINGLTMGGVGSGTTLDHIQVSFSGDDSFEWFGGAVNAKHLIAFRGLDDDFDTDFSFTGNIQFGLIIRDEAISDAAGDSNGFESDNYNPGVGRTPITKAIFSNITCVGPKRDGSVTPSSTFFGKALRIRRNSAISVYNSLFVGWSKGLSIESAETQNNFVGTTSLDSLGVFANNSFVNMPACQTTGSAAYSFYQNFFTLLSNDSTQTVSNVNWVNAFPTNLEDAVDFRLNVSSTVAANASFSNPHISTQVVGIKSVENKISAIGLYPNPAASAVNINIELNSNEKVSVSIFDITGKLVSTVIENTEMNAGSNSVNVSTNNLSNGLYFVSVSTGNFVQTQKLVISK